MVGLLIRSLVLMLITLGVSGATAPQSLCTNATLTGRYIFEGHGFIEPIEPGVERLHYGYFFFDGHGGLTGRQSSSRGGRSGREDRAGGIGGNICARCGLRGDVEFSPRKAPRHRVVRNRRRNSLGYLCHWQRAKRAHDQNGPRHNGGPHV